MIVTKKHCAVFGILTGLLLSFVTFFALYNPLVSVRLKSARFSGQVELTKDEGKALARELAGAETLTGKGYQEPDYVLIIRSRKGSTKYLISEDNLVYESKGRRVQVTDNFFEILKGPEERLEGMNPFGDMVDWAEADKVFPKFARAEVQDVDTGLSFWVQRRAGRAHADVQPLTAEDSAIMKKIYGGRWSWKRKAIIVKVKGKKLAASMNGMPHGAGAISGNDFPGHFCIHFLKSKTHSGRVNLEHQIMVWKAAGRFAEMTRNMDPKKTVEVFFTAVDQEELTLARQLTIKNDGKEKTALTELLGPVQWVTLKEIKAEEIKKTGEQREKGKTVAGEQLVYVSLEMGLNNVAKTERAGYLTLFREKGNPSWKIESGSLVELMKEKELENAD